MKIPVARILEECEYLSQDWDIGGTAFLLCARNSFRYFRKEFGTLITAALDGYFESQKDFSIVQFATNAQIVRYPNPAEQTIAAIDALDYTGGSTNHQAAIEMCQETLRSGGSSGGDRKNFIMIVSRYLFLFSIFRARGLT